MYKFLRHVNIANDTNEDFQNFLSEDHAPVHLDFIISVLCYMASQHSMKMSELDV